MSHQLAPPILIAMLLVSCDRGATVRTSHVSNITVLAATLAPLHLSAPALDVEESLKRSDRRFIGINGFTCSAPGVDAADPILKDGYELRCLDGTSDVIEGPEHAALREKASSYAAAYNRELLRRLRAGLIT